MRSLLEEYKEVHQGTSSCCLPRNIVRISEQLAGLTHGENELGEEQRSGGVVPVSGD